MKTLRTLAVMFGLLVPSYALAGTTGAPACCPGPCCPACADCPHT